MTAPLTWMHDQMLFLIAIIEIAVLLVQRDFSIREYGIVTAYIFINLIALSLIPGNRFKQQVFIWMPVTFLFLYTYSKQYLSTKPTSVNNSTTS
jgi:hypothetical protein